jgi:hypothetical protein
VYASRRTLGRHFHAEGLPAPIDWAALARAVLAHRTFVRGGPLRIAAVAADYLDQFTMSNAMNRIFGIRPSQLRSVSWCELLDVALPTPERSVHREFSDDEMAQWDARVNHWAEAHGANLTDTPAPALRPWGYWMEIDGARVWTDDMIDPQPRLYGVACARRSLPM